jgi:V8-like Glu-specific endopeptidase
MIHYRVGLFALLCLSATSLSAQSLQIVKDLPTLSRSISINECSPTVFVSKPNKWTFPYAPRERYMWMRPKITVDEPSIEKPWTIEIVVNDHTVQTLTRSDLAPDLHTLWATLIEAEEFTVQLTSSSNIDGMKVCLESVNVPRTAVSVKSVIDSKDDRVDLVATYGTHSRYYDYGKSVVLIRFQDVDNGGTESNCTGVVISSTLVATNNHCIDDRTNLGTSFVIIGHESGAPVELRAGIVCLVATNSRLDYSIIRLDRELKDVAKISVGDVKKGTHLILIQHPEAQPKLIAVVSKKKCFVQQAPAQDRQTDFYHLCDSSGGSSGSPVMDEASGVVYGLHHLGATDQKRHDYHNLAVSFREISNDLKDRYPLIYQEITAVSRGAS